MDDFAGGVVGCWFCCGFCCWFCCCEVGGGDGDGDDDVIVVVVGGCGGVVGGGGGGGVMVVCGEGMSAGSDVGGWFATAGMFDFKYWEGREDWEERVCECKARRYGL